MLKATSVLALMGSCPHVAFGAKHVGRGGDDLTEDIDFWTRMTQEVGSIPLPIRTPSPTRRPTSQPTPRVTLAPVPAPVPDTSTPSYSPTPAEETPSPVTDSPVSEQPVSEQPVSGIPTYSPTGSVVTDSPVSEQPVSVVPTYSPTSASPCGLSPDDRAEQFRQLALTVTDEATLSDANSSQAQALDWLLNEDVLDPPLCPDDGPCKALQRYVMASFYFASDGGSWTGCNAPDEYTPAAIAVANAQCNRIVTPFPVSNPRIGDTSTNAWLTPVNECEWGGVACWGTDDDRNGCMDQIDFENNGLAGTLIPEMHNLDELRFFILEQGSTSGTIPTEYGMFDRLVIFDMDFNDLTGTIPDELYNMKLLQHLDLNDNNLSGPISPAIGNLETLTFLQLDHNELDGTIPAEVGELKALRIAFFSDNDLTGVMPAEVCANRNNTSTPGLLGTLVADCYPPDPVVECSCCPSCNVLEPFPTEEHPTWTGPPGQTYQPTAFSSPKPVTWSPVPQQTPFPVTPFPTESSPQPSKNQPSSTRPSFPTAPRSKLPTTPVVSRETACQDLTTFRKCINNSAGKCNWNTDDRSCVDATDA